LPDEKVDAIVFKSRPSLGEIAVEVKVPFRELAQQLQERLRLVELYKDLPRGRKRRGWEKEFIRWCREIPPVRVRVPVHGEDESHGNMCCRLAL
jgi:hypothetical protein